MAKKKSEGGEDTASKGGGGAMKLVVPLVALVVGVFAGPKLLGSPSGGAASAATTTTTAPGPVVTLDPVTLNLTDGHLLKLGLALQISADWWNQHGSDDAAFDADDPTKGYAQALDVAIGVFGQRSMDQLLQTSSREAARTELTVKLNEAYRGQIDSIYLYEFVMQ